MSKDITNIKNNILSTDLLHNHAYFEQQYLALRQKENRIYTDAELLNLPQIGKDHPHYKEWLIRQNSFQKLLRYLKHKKKSLDILEIGCGNGWLSNQLSLCLNCQVTGLDINGVEIEQAKRVFKQNMECTFIYGELESGLAGHKKFDLIIFAASLQYFQSAKDILNTARRFLKAGGEIHIIDSPFYKASELEAARQRSRSHFISLGFEGMSSMYFHHSLNELTDLHPVILYDPFILRNRLFKSTVPFYWISIKKN